MQQKELPKFLIEKAMKARIAKVKKGTTLQAIPTDQYQPKVSIKRDRSPEPVVFDRIFGGSVAKSLSSILPQNKLPKIPSKGDGNVYHTR